MRNELKRARDEVGAAKDEAEELKLKLEQLNMDFGAKVEEAQAFAIEDFEKSEELDRLKGEYILGSYIHALKEARAFLRTKMPEVAPEELKMIPDIAETLKLSDSDNTVDGATDDEDTFEEGYAAPEDEEKE